MITNTSLSHPTLLLKTKQAIISAVKHKRETHVKNKRGQIILAVTFSPQGMFRICDVDRHDRTEVVKGKLRGYHAMAQSRQCCEEIFRNIEEIACTGWCRGIE